MIAIRWLLCGWLAMTLAGISLAAPKAEDVPPLIAKLKDKDAKVRAEAVKEIGYIGAVKAAFTKAAVAPLIDVLKDSDANVRREAATALGDIKPDRKLAIPALTELLKDKDNGVRAAAASSLGSFGTASKDALPMLKEIQKELAALNQDEKNKVGFLIQAVELAIRSISGMQ